MKSVIIFPFLFIFSISCIVVVNDIHDNSVDMGDLCELIKEKFKDDDAGSKAIPRSDDELREDGEECEKDSQCQSESCICDVCIDLNDLY